MNMQLTAEQIETFLRAVDSSFPVPLSEKQDLHEYARKLHELAFLRAVVECGRIVALVAGYVNRDPAYIAIVAALPEVRGRGLAKGLVQEFMSAAEQKGASFLHLYAVRTNEAAMGLYRGLGFSEWVMPDEPRKDDVHLIYKFR
jgi:ribosomal protein S18 acetylase RimI-like enzyme